ncbi:hypothetical protein SAMN05444266_103490 [Chitinophaga jiangningensis]|uniref:Uncharacterized protein n=1 Tax=Chitinophaga jiangningensis TaxID=1419482 RepID=A0A1M7B1I0_9BACT|nr:hypothetical protein [Chitinophaga jiangningensis]SHL48791.1 hypothetical protein SAMN05444266_103490 [Chitinophaga jiangningensis]
MQDNHLQEEKPPLFPSWNYWYILVVAWLALLIILFYLFTKTFS